MKALVIGGTGPTGPYVVKGLIHRGFEVTILHRGTHEVDLPPEVDHIHGDPHFEEHLKLALGDRKFDLAVGLYGRLRYVANVLKGRISRFISVGAGATYQGWSQPGGAPEDILIPTPEDAPIQNDPRVNKFIFRIVEAETEVMKAHQERQYNATHFRYPMIYGPRQLAPHEWSILRRILDKRKRLIVVNGGLTIRSRGYAENMAQALLLAVDKPEESAGQIYNIRDDRLLTNRGWISIICKVMHYQFEFVEMPYPLARPARVYSWGPQHYVTDIRKVKDHLGYHDPVPADKAIELTLKWYLENRPLPGGIEEQQLRDPFDYDLEDRLMDEFMVSWRRLRDLQPTPLGFRHPYDHPDRPGDLPS